MSEHKPIFVTRPLLPDLDEYLPYLKAIWESGFLTNSGPFHQQLEDRLSEYLRVPHIALFNNATVALLIALKALDIRGEVITTPYSFVATSHALVWNGVTPVFVDIDRDSFNIDPKKIEAALTENTSAILAVHCYGTPCDTEEIKAIAQKHRLKVIYDAAHAFAVEDKGGSVLNAGDLSVLSFHATKVFNTFEGGAIVCRDPEMKRRIDQLKNFGYKNEITIDIVGINGKLNEVSAAFGLLQLKHIDPALARRQAIDALYRRELSDTKGLQCSALPTVKRHNHAYFPILIDTGFKLGRDDLVATLAKANIHVRRYFYPLISNFSVYARYPSAAHGNLPIANDVAERVICLPIYPDMTDADVYRVCACLRDATA